MRARTAGSMASVSSLLGTTGVSPPATACDDEDGERSGGVRKRRSRVECGGSVEGVWRRCGGSVEGGRRGVEGVWRECGGSVKVVQRRRPDDNQEVACSSALPNAVAI
jgi:hypothetical protein